KGPVQLRHELEIHAVNAGHHGRRNADHRHDGQDLEQIVLRDIDEAEHRVEEKLDFIGQMLFERIERGNVLVDPFETAAEFGNDPVVLERKHERHDATEAEKHVA